jgi:DNA repair exonuclease SbcCD ATPase subunit
MHKKEFVQSALIAWLPQTGWNFDKAMKFAEKAWRGLEARGYGDAKPSKPREIAKAYEKLKQNPVMQAAFDLFWVAYDYKHGKDRAAMRWLQLGELDKEEYDRIIAAARRAVQTAKNLPEGQARKYPEGWLSERRWMDDEKTQTEIRQNALSAAEQQYRRVNQDLAHAKNMAKQTGESYWQQQVEKFTEQLRNLRGSHE